MAQERVVNSIRDEVLDLTPIPWFKQVNIQYSARLRQERLAREAAQKSAQSPKTSR